MDKNYNIELINSEESFNACIKDLRPDTQEELLAKDILILPEINYGNLKETLYHEDVIGFLDYIREQETSLNYGLCSDNEKILSLNDNELWLGSFLIYAPMINPHIVNIFINMLSSYLYDKFIKLGKNPEVKCKIKVVKGKDTTSKTFDYTGDAETLRAIAPSLIEKFNNEQ